MKPKQGAVGPYTAEEMEEFREDVEYATKHNGVEVEWLNEECTECRLKFKVGFAPRLKKKHN